MVCFGRQEVGPSQAGSREEAGELEQDQAPMGPGSLWKMPF